MNNKKMPTPLNPIVIARLRKYWYKNEECDLDQLLYELEGWIVLLGPGPTHTKCENCCKNVGLDWKLCRYCPSGRVVCWKCYQCSKCEEEDSMSSGCCECGESCGAYMCKACKIMDQ